MTMYSFIIALISDPKFQVSSLFSSLKFTIFVNNKRIIWYILNMCNIYNIMVQRHL